MCSTVFYSPKWLVSFLDSQSLPVAKENPHVMMLGKAGQTERAKPDAECVCTGEGKIPAFSKKNEAQGHWHTARYLAGHLRPGCQMGRSG